MRYAPTCRFRASTWLTVALLLGGAAPSAGADDPTRNDPKRLQVIVDELAERLTLTSTVTTAVVPVNPLLVSVAPQDGRQDAFVLSFEEEFLGGLDDDGLRAVVAHELGHVWIFTHHPYLQTESLANSVALRVVSRQSLEKVYGRVWERLGTKGDLAQFLGQ